jgi:arginase
MSYRYAVIPAPSALGLRVGGVARAPAALLEQGLADTLGARVGQAVAAPRADGRIDPRAGVLNAEAIAAYARDLAAAIDDSLVRDEFPIVLGGDCSILLGAMTALRKRGRYGLLFLDGHADFYQPEADQTGEAASMELGFVTGRGPELLTGPQSRGPLVRDEDVIVVGFRDADLAAAEGSRPLPPTIKALDLTVVRTYGAEHAAKTATNHLTVGESAQRFWIHLDVDVLHDEVMPAVDYRQPDGLSWSELGQILDAVLASGRAVGLELTIFNPDLDPEGLIAQDLSKHLSRIFDAHRERGRSTGAGRAVDPRGS